MLTQLKKAGRMLRQGDFDTLFGEMGSHLPGWLFFHYRFVLVSTDNPLLSRAGSDEFVTSILKPEDLPDLETSGFSVPLLKSRMEAGDRAAIVRDKKGRVLAIGWGSTGGRFDKVEGTPLSPEAGGVIIYGLRTLPEARGKGLITLAYRRLWESFVAEGRRRIYSTIGVLNEVSLKVHDKFGFEVVGEGTYLRLFGLAIGIHRRWPFETKRLVISTTKPPRNRTLWYLP